MSKNLNIASGAFYEPDNAPTAQSVGAVNKQGDSMKGSLLIYNGSEYREFSVKRNVGVRNDLYKAAVSVEEESGAATLSWEKGWGEETKHMCYSPTGLYLDKNQDRVFSQSYSERVNDTTIIPKTLPLTTAWADTGITGADLQGDGTYVVQVYNGNTAAGFYYMGYSGIMYWTAGETNSTDTCDIPLHYTGHANNGKIIYLRTCGQPRTTGNGKVKLQIRCNVAISGSSSMSFKFRKLI